MNKKNRTEYLRKKKLKEEAKKKESEHKVDYSECPVRYSSVPHSHNPYHDFDPLTMMYLLKYGMRKRSMCGILSNKEMES